MTLGRLFVRKAHKNSLQFDAFSFHRRVKISLHSDAVATLGLHSYAYRRLAGE